MRKRSALILAVPVLSLAVALLASAADQSEESAHHGKAAAMQMEAAPPKAFDSPPAEGAKATCPVLGNVFTIGKDTLHSEYKGRHYYFCCADCRPKFDADPEKYLKGEQAPAKMPHSHHSEHGNH